jgi:hypothetical protein
MSPLELSYMALRAVSGPTAERWWSVARLRADVPAAVAALMGGRSRVELSTAEADAALAWAATVDGWAEAEPKPLLLHRAGARAS